MATNPAVLAGTGKTFLGHPRGLFVLFFAEMWERFSYYGMRAILILFLTKHFLFGDEPAYALYGAYTSMVYITPVLGGYLADRYLGARKAVLAGGIFIAIGHIMLALVEGPQGVRDWHLDGFYLGLAFIIIGTGFLKANISVLVGQLYPRDDVRRDGAFSIFYMGINLGGWLGPIACGILGETVGWGWGFGAAGVGMILGLIVFVLFRGELHGAGEPADPVMLRQPVAAGLSREWMIYLGGIVGVFVSWWLIQYSDAVGWSLIACFAISWGYILYKAVVVLPPQDRDRLLAALFLIFLCPLFWALFEQSGSSLNLFTDRSVDRNMLGWEVPASVFQSVNSIFIILLAPLFAALWTMLGRRGLEPSAPFKFGIGLVLVGAGFLVLVAGAPSIPGELTPVIFIFLVYLFHTMAELCFSPIGLSNMTRLSVASMVGLMMGTWFLATAAGNFIASIIARATGGEGAGVEKVLGVYSNIGWFAIGIGVVVLVIAPFVAKLMHLDTLGEQQDTEHALAGQSAIGEPAAAGMPTDRELK